MSLYDRRKLIVTLTALPLLAACGFRPALAPGGAAEGLRGRVRADDPDDALGFAFVERLEQRLGAPGAGADLALAYVITTGSRNVGVTPEGTATRVQIAGEVQFELTAGDGARVLSGTVRGFTAWSTTGTALAAEIAAEDARRRLMVILADDVVTRLYAADLPASAAP